MNEAAEGAVAAAPDATPNAVAIVLLDAGRMLLVRRAARVPRPGFWSPPTGWIEPGESAAEAAEREALEELGVVVEAQRELWRCRSDDGRLLIAWWEVRRVQGTMRPCADEIAELRFVDADGYFALSPTFEQHHAFFRDVLPALLTPDGPSTRA